MPTLFSRIINGEIPCYKIAEDENYFAFLDINPLKKGHTLVIPKVETDYIFQLDNQTLAGLIVFAKKAGLAIEKAIPCKRIGIVVMELPVPLRQCRYVYKGLAIEKAIPCKRIGIVVMGLEVPHAHIHLIPMESEGDLNFKNPKLKFAPEEMNMIAENIRNNF